MGKMDQKKTPNHLSNKQNNSLLPLLLALIFLVVAFGGYFFLSDEEGITHVAQQQLKMIGEGQLDAAYNQYFSQDYKKNMSLQGFKRFVANHPVLKNNDQISFYGIQEDQDKGEMTGVLKDSKKGSVPILLHLVKENRQWKVSDLQVLAYGAAREEVRDEEMALLDSDAPRIAPVSADQMVEMVVVLEAHLKGLREGNIEEAYQKYTSKDFKDATPYAAYVDFLKQYPEMQGHTAVSFSDRGFKDDRGIIRATLVFKKELYPVDFSLVKENGAWKIWSLKARPLDASSKVDEKEKKELITLVNQHLDFIKDGQPERAYQNKHRDFKEATNLEDFHEFVGNFPELTNHEEISYGEAKSQGPLATMPVILKSQNGESTFTYWFRQEQGEWKILGMHVNKSSSYPPIEEDDKTVLSTMIKEQLQALKSGDYSQAYYGFTASDFEKSTSLQAFKEFVASYPIFQEFQKMDIQEAVKEGELRLVKVTLVSPKEQAEVDYRFSLEGKKWKVWGIQIMTNPIAAPVYHDEKVLTSIITDQLSALQQGDLSKAYYAYTSPDFQETSSRDVFVKFMQGHAIFKNNVRIGTPKITFKDTLATALVELESEQGEKKIVEYKFAYAQGKWKIMAMKIVEDVTPKEVADKLKQKKMIFSKVLIGTETDAHGIVTKNNTLFSPADKEITVNLQVSQSIPGSTIQMVLEHLESGSKISPVEATLKNEGDSMVTFVFSPPTEGWPVGVYKLHVTSSTGLEANYSFVVQQEKKETAPSTKSDVTVPDEVKKS